MIDPDKRNAVFTLHQEGMAAREISRRLNISRSMNRRCAGVKLGFRFSMCLQSTVRQDDRRLL